ncbi:MAG: T9SS type A sorting domain-containing protein [Flavobacteriales bacterium]
MPFGLGGVRADIGIYGGPDNWFWGGEPIPDGSPIITAISDSPQDQGGIVGVLFDKSVWDDNDLENKVTSYSIWRNFDAEGNSIDTISDGNWQLMGYMPAQAFDAYAYEAPTLGDSSLAEGSFNSCFVVLAHTQDSSVYWYSDVMCGYSTDDISPNTTEVFAELVNEEEVMISWNPPTDEDYSYSEVISSSGFNTSNITDTLTYDISFESGDLITYGVIHYDVNGNPSDTSFVSIQIEDQKDYIPLYQGWNLISTRLTPNENNMPAIFSSLEPNNLIYATGFNNGVSVYDPNGLPFLNTLSQFDDGYGYWVKVNEDDTLVINGNPISHDFIPPYNAGWNLMGYTEGVTQSISSYFDFLLNENNLIYVTNFNQGAAFYDPNGLPFLNSLNYVEDNLGYWVKTSSPFGGIAYRLSHDSQEYSPNFMLINGESNLSEYIGNKVQVYNQLMEKIAELEIIEGGYLMTNAIYGDDPATEVIEGMENGELLSFGFMNHIIEDKIEFNADMNLRKVNLNFEVSDVISIYPNPLRDLINIRINEADDCELDIQIFDIAGRLVYSDLNRAYFKGSDKVSVDFSEFENGAYYLKLFIDNELRFNESIIKQ